MFERLTERSRVALSLAEQEARDLHHNYVGTEHVLLGLISEREGLAAHCLQRLGVNFFDVKAAVRRIVGRGAEELPDELPYTPRSKKVLELSLREALSLGHNYIGTEHILLGLVRENEGVAARILLDADCDAERIRNEIIRALNPKRGYGLGHRVARKVTMASIRVSPSESPSSAYRRGWNNGYLAGIKEGANESIAEPKDTRP